MEDYSFKKKNALQKALLKLTNKTAYRQYKRDLAEYKLLLVRQNQVSKVKKFLDTTGSFDLNKILTLTEGKRPLTVSHSGNAGDIIYAMPTLKRIHELTGIPLHVFFRIDQPLVLPYYFRHPLGSVMLNQKMADMLLPLIQTQPYVENAGIYTHEKIHLDLDNFRRCGISLDQGDIARWCSYIAGVNPELHKPWLFVKPDPAFTNKVIIARSGRYRNPLIDYSFLNKYDNLIFVGTPSEFQDLKKTIAKIELITVENFLQLAAIIASCKLFIGNQSFPFAVAESLKVPRLLELCLYQPNVMPAGPNGNDFFFQNHFESLVAMYLSTDSR